MKECTNEECQPQNLLRVTLKYFPSNKQAYQIACIDKAQSLISKIQVEY